MPAIAARATASRCFFGERERPGAPTITGSTPGVSSLSIAFDAPEYTGGLLVSKYEHAVSTDGSAWSEWSNAVSGTTPPTSPVSISNLTNGQAYYVKLRAVNLLGPSEDSNTWNTTTTPRSAPDSPTLISLSRGYRQLTAEFSAPSFDGGSAITDYEYSIDNGTSWSSMSQSNTTAYVITGLDDFTSYQVRIRAINTVGSGNGSNMLSAFTAGVTVAPASLAATTNGVFQSVLTWTAPDSNASAITDYVVQYSTSSNFSSDVNTFADGTASSTGATVTSLSASTTYYFRVASVNQVGQSGWSSIVSATTAGVPSQVSTPTSSAGDRIFTISWTIPANNGNSITAYKVQYSSNGGSSWSTAETFSSGSTEFTNRTKSWALNNGVSYIGRVLAVNEVGDGDYSPASTARTPAFAAPSLTANANYASLSEPNVRRITWSVDPTDVAGSSSSSGTTTKIYLQWMVADGLYTTAQTAEELIATYSGNSSTGGFGTSFTNSGLVSASEQYRIRAEQFSSQDTGYVVSTGWINLSVIATQTYQAPSYLEWQEELNVDVYSMTALVSGNTYTKTSGGIPGVNTDTEGSIQYSVLSFRVVATGRSNSSASTTSRCFYLQQSGTNTTLPPVSQTSDASNTWSGASNNTMTYTWNTTDIAYGNAGAGKIKVLGLGLTTYSTNPDQRIDVTITAKGNKRTRVNITPAPVNY